MKRYRAPTIDDIKRRCKINEDTDCWHWMNSKHANGYGRIRVDGKTYFVHRYVYALVKGPIPAGIDVRNECSHRDCCNPEHLKGGTRNDTMKKAVKAGRTSSGLRHSIIITTSSRSRAKLNLQKAREIRLLYAGGSLPKQLAIDYGVCIGTIHKIISGESWIDHHPLHS